MAALPFFSINGAKRDKKRDNRVVNYAPPSQAAGYTALHVARNHAVTHEMLIGIAVAVVVAVLLGVKSLAHRVLTFKMDESSIVNFITESSEGNEFRSTEAISAGTDIDVSRVAFVCSKSNIIKRNPNENESWCVM